MEDFFHKGEINIQEKTGERHIALINGRILSDAVPEGAVPFIAQQKFVVLSTSDSQKDIWISMLTGNPGFARSGNDRRQIFFRLPCPQSQQQDPVFKNLLSNSPIGGLFIELSTRLRLRINGKVADLKDDAMTLAIEQAYPNCPKYIQRRRIKITQSEAAPEHRTLSGTSFTRNISDVIENADTMFVGSADDNGNCDASHRGGSPGFVRIVDRQTLCIPDYSGNSMFNTLGNFHLNPRAGLLFLDFEKNRQYHLTGSVTLNLDGDDTEGMTGGTNRWWQFRLCKWVMTPLAHSFKWEFVEFSPFIPMPLEITKIKEAAQDIKEFTVEHPDGCNLPVPAAGSHIEITLQKNQKTYIRRYSLTSHIEDRSHYRFAVLKASQSRGSSAFLHEKIKTGDKVNVLGPFKDFGIEPDAPSHILIAGGIGITPFVPMVEELASAKMPFQLHYAARSKNRFAFKERLLKAGGNRIFFYGTRTNGHGRSRIDIGELIAGQSRDAHFYVCGPRSMIETVKEEAFATGFLSEQVHFESFGSSFKDTDKPVRVRLALSGINMEVKPGQTLLDAILERHVFAPYECRRGECGSCMTEVLSGEPDHRDVNLTRAQRKYHMCTCVSWADSRELVLNL